MISGLTDLLLLLGYSRYGRYSDTDPIAMILGAVIFGVGLVIWSFFKAYEMTVEEKRLKEKELKWEDVQNSQGMTSEWGKVKVKTQRKRRRNSSFQNTGEYFKPPF